MNLKEKYVKLTPQSRLYQMPVPIIGLTGGIATGKSQVCSYLRQGSLPIIDADQNVKAIYQSKEAKEFIQQNFPSAIDSKGNIDFPHLRQEVFSDTQKKDLVEKFIYPRLPEQFLKSYKDLGNPGYIIYDVPLLFEKGLAPLIDVIVTVYTPKEIQLLRLMQRDGISEVLAQRIIDAQEDIEHKRKKSDLIIDNSKDLDRLKRNTESALENLFEQMPFTP